MRLNILLTMMFVSAICFPRAKLQFTEFYKILQPEPVQTTDATETTFYSETIEDNSVEHVTVTCNGVKSDKSKRETLVEQAVIYRAGGSATVEGSVVVTFDQSTAGYDMDIDVSGNDWRVRVTGAALETVDWKCMIEVRNL